MSHKFVKKSLKVWSDTLNEEILCENMTGTNMLQEKKLNGQRGVESYDYESARFNNDDISDKKRVPPPSSYEMKRLPKNHLQAAQDLIKTKNDSDQNQIETVVEENKGSLRDRLGSKVAFDETKSRSHIKATELDSDDHVAKEITWQLREPNDEIIQRCVKVLGKKKSLELLYSTEDIQNRGGMLTSEGGRKRSPGGVYLQLIKKDETILNAQRAKIFIDDIAKKKAAKKIKRLNQRRRFSQAKAKLEQKVSGDTAGASCSGDSALANETCTDENEAGGEKEEEAEFSEMREEEMIYFEE